MHCYPIQPYEKGASMNEFSISQKVYGNDYSSLMLCGNTLSINSNAKNGLFKLSMMASNVKKRIQHAFPKLTVNISFDNYLEEYFIAVCDEKVFFSDEYLAFINKIQEELEEQNITSIMFTCDDAPVESSVNTICESVVDVKISQLMDSFASKWDFVDDEIPVEAA